MGANASNYPHSCSPRVGGNSQAQQTFIGTSSYSHQGYGCESKLYSLDHGHEKPQDKKKKSSGLATLKKKFIKRRKSSRSADHAKQMRELLSGWDVRDVNALVEEYEGTSALKELSLQASLARPEARTLQKDMADLYEYKYCTDVDLIFQETCFPVHRAILAARCPFFKTLLSSSPEYGAEIIMDINTAGIDMPMFSALLHYLYTGEFGMEDSRFQNVDILVQLSEEFGTPNSLDVDMRGLFDYMCYYDVVLSFSSNSEMVESFGGSPNCLDEELRAHKAIISSRSPFFRHLLQRRIRTGEEITDRTLRTPTRIILDESIIPKKYAKVILNCMYTDVVDLSVLHCSPSVGSLSEVQALVAGKLNMTRAEEAMELYHIALFLEFNMLAQGCEDIIAESISLDTLIAILKWSSQPYGSKWVHRQALHFLCEEFTQVMTSDVFYELSKDHLLTAIQSDYLQASEQDILKYLVKWGEHQLMKRIADREPNLLSGTAHSVNKRGVKRRDLDIEELREILSSLLPVVRIEHILPMNSEILSDAMKRGLISTPPSDMLPTAEGGKSNAWLRQKNAGIYVRPRLFSPYVEEAKSVLDEMMVEQTDLVRLRMVRMSNVPDTLYMVNNAVPQCCHMISHQQMSSNQSSPPSVVANEIPVPHLLVVKEMVKRLQELRHTEQVQRAYALNCGEGATVSYEIQIRVLREFGLSDAAAELLQNPHKFFPDERFGDESPLLTMRQSGRCRVNSTPTAETMFTELDSFVAFHPPLPPPPPPYHPPATPIHSQFKMGWKQRVPSQHPSRSFSYPCNHSLFHSRTAPKVAPPVYVPGVKAAAPPDCTNTTGLGRQTVAAAAAVMAAEKQACTQPMLNELMPDIAMGVSTMSLKDRRLPELTVDTELSQPVTEVGPGPPQHISCIQTRHMHSSRKKHAIEQKIDTRENQQEYPDFYDFSNAACRPSTPAPSRHTPSPSQGMYFGPDLYSHSKASPSGLKSAYLPNQLSPKKQEDSRREYVLSQDGHQHRQKNEPIHLDVLEQPPQRLDLALAAQENAGNGPVHIRGRTKMETDLTYGLTSNRPSLSTYSSEIQEERSSRRLTDEEPLEHEAQRNTDLEREDAVSRGRRSPSKPDFLYKKSAL
ncbi:BTB/POZ domain-containing protein 7 [Mauremys mutica]|uniref:BTB/POZ domain-containing protein 7 n=1 Tax=Mauremys mutica TaxID=74926 RepID=A0A9D3X396_9SAUR|nr:BTB/POZ domain-containing protein 7 isoform X1 [Mauremys reevesii]XP_039392705.1 BTB/POZ domain-containing protein 7 isoform X1 [Mauremys reevesii]XP_039392706.1 BTB/POZ domain-containing protein 7 isoform X1 [Mauremys reevesii]XP_039392707.1 BTB/POZ domain-containing protein 7 isoform X1 [Mauremys reevesii]XP_039392708.1 BTB/POZ domain-containing protein 7 isoform X1 [Mauremys reevesii]XP_039392709.1 BTB/POZ domain-containing protein 7 isoform X1 [Mauremys reevesii]XP_039392711.1 BTB/POZ 